MIPACGVVTAPLLPTARFQPFGEPAAARSKVATAMEEQAMKRILKGRCVTLALGVFVLGIGLFAARAGNLEPNGPPAPTDRHTIYQADIPLVISTPGSYVVKENLTGVAGSHAIEITATDVTLDLNGFELVGVPGSLDGVHAGPLSHNFTLKNGTIRDWGGMGAFLSGNTNLVEYVHASGNDGIGINSGIGIWADAGSIVQHCTASNNANEGIRVGVGSLVSHCIARGNLTDGIRGQSNRVTIRDCVSEQNSGDGIQVAAESYV